MENIFDTTLEEDVEREIERRNKEAEEQKVWKEIIIRRDEVHRLANLKMGIKDKKESAVIIDLDNTICLLGDRDPFNAETCEKDAPNLTVWKVAHELHRQGHLILYVSARNEKHREATRAWLETHRCPKGLLVMKEDEVKEGGDSALRFKHRKTLELLELFDIPYAIDDNIDNLAMYRSLGIHAYHPSLL